MWRVSLYDSEFFEAQAEASRRSAEVVVPIVTEMIRPTSVIDIGCGIGTWLAEFELAGISDYLGIDGEYVPRQQLQIPSEHFRAADLTEPLSLNRTYDLAVCLEVAEHLPPSHAGALVALLTSLAPVVLFSAAIPHQTGSGHVNEQPQEFWRRLFSKHGFFPVDCIRPYVWGNPQVCWWYQQNALLYVAQSVLRRRKKLKPVPHAVSLDIVHPALVEIYRSAELKAKADSEVARNSVTALTAELESERHTRLTLSKALETARAEATSALIAAREKERLLIACERQLRNHNAALLDRGRALAAEVKMVKEAERELSAELMVVKEAERTLSGQLAAFRESELVFVALKVGRGLQRYAPWTLPIGKATMRPFWRLYKRLRASMRRT
jgi:SAM-dependent methyltransferase